MSNRKKLLVDRDALMNASRSKVADACVAVFDRLQGLPKETQILALAAAFLLSTDASRIPAQEAFTATKNLMFCERTASKLDLQFQAMKFHLNTDLLEDTDEGAYTGNMGGL